MTEHQEVIDQYLRDSGTREWIGEATPQWAVWFAKCCLSDRWPQAELLIASDREANTLYRKYVSLVRDLGMLDHTIGEHQIKRDRDKTMNGLVCARRALLYGE